MKGKGKTSDVSPVLGVGFALAAERKLVRPCKSFRHIDLAVMSPRADTSSARTPLALALVLDRSGSMQGSKLATAKAAALAVLDRLEESDRATVTIFDNEVETILPDGPMTQARKRAAHKALSTIEARANTALHEGWLTGCHSIAQDSTEAGTSPRLARCLLLTDGLANEGLTDAEKIASQAAEIRAKSGISTSTFGIGTDYDEGLLAPMAVAGNGQFHHLRDEADIAATFEGELGELFGVTSRSVRIELECDGSIEAELVSLYWNQQRALTGPCAIELGDLISGEVRHAVVRLAFLGQKPGAFSTVRARVSWLSGAERLACEWQELVFECAEHDACDAEPRNASVMHWVGLHHAEKAKKEALELFKRDEVEAAVARLDSVIKRLSEYARGDPDLEMALAALKEARKVYKEGRVTDVYLREECYQAQMSSRGQRDHRAKR